MYRIDDPSASATMPNPEAAGQEGYWTEGDPASGVPATLERASWFNMIQEELRAVVVAGGQAPSKTTYNQVLTAIQKLIRQALGSRAGTLVINSNTALNASHIGLEIIISGTSGPITITLPATSAAVAGSSVRILNMSNTQHTVACAPGPDSVAGTGATVTSIPLRGYENLELTALPASALWEIAGGSAALRYGAGFAALLSVPGYQTLPSGMLIQIGTASSVSSSAGNPIIFPYSFPNACLQVIASGYSNQLAAFSTDSYTRFGFTLYGGNPNGQTYATVPARYIAIGN